MKARIFLVFALATLIALPEGLAQKPDDPDVKLLQSAQIAPDGPALIDYFRQRTASPAENQAITVLLRELGDAAYPVRERATEALIAKGLPAISLLRQALTNSDIEIARRAERCLQAIEKVPSAAVSAAAARLLAKHKAEGAAAVLVGYLPLADDAAVVAEIRDALAALAGRAGRAEPALLKALDSELPLVRGAAGEALIRGGFRDARRLQSDPNADVRLRVTLAIVVHAKDKSAVATLINLLPDLTQAQARSVEDVLIRLAGDANPAVSVGPEGDTAARARCRDAWNEWWSRSAATIDLARLDAEPAMLGLTLILQLDSRVATGRVFEINLEGQVQWKIDSLSFPVDAIVVDKDRVLIAEAGVEAAVSLRDFRNKVIWKKAVGPGTSPVNVQALPNGSVLIASRQSVIEWDDKQTVRFHYTRSPPDILAAAKDRNGEYVFVTNQSKCIRIDGNKTVLKETALTNVRFGFVGLDLLPSGRFLIGYLNEVAEFEPNGQKGWHAEVAGQTNTAQRLPNRKTLVTSINEQKVLELDFKGNTAWEYPRPAGCAALDDGE